MPRWMWIVTLLCASASLSSGTLCPPLVVRTGQNVSLTCNLTSTSEVTWYRVRSDHVQPLLTVRPSFSGEDTEDVHAEDIGRLSSAGSVSSGVVALQMRAVTAGDGGLYFCSAECSGSVCVRGGAHLTVSGPDGAAADALRTPCWTAGVCAAPGLLAMCVLFIVGLYLCSGKRVGDCRGACRPDGGVTQVEEEHQHYWDPERLRKPRPPAMGGARFVEERVVYSTVANPKSPNRSRDHR